MSAQVWTGFRGDLAEFSLISLLGIVERRNLQGSLLFSPLGLRLHLDGRYLEAAEGLQPLGGFLRARGLLSEAELAEALKGPLPLGQALLAQKKLGPEDLQAVLALQARVGLGLALKLRRGLVAFQATPPLPAPSARLALSQELLHLCRQERYLPLGVSFRLAPVKATPTLSAEEWSVLRHLNGRRTLQAAIQMCGLDFSLAERAVMGLLDKGLLEPAAVMGLRLIVPRQRPPGSNYHPPSTIRANLFLKSADGRCTAEEIGRSLKATPEETAALLCDLYREGLLEIVRGHQELKNLLDEF
ncbi:MAG: hypothetical protein C4327_11470 [Meiothermus sp.]